MGKPFQLQNGTVLLSIEAPGGLYNSTQLKKIATLCDQQLALVRATEDQRIALFAKEDHAAQIQKELEIVGLGVRHYQDGLHGAVACLGKLCPDHEQDAMGAAMEIAKELKDMQVSNCVKVGINGCQKCCVPCHTLDLSIVGDVSGYRLSLGGKTSQIPEMASYLAEGVPASKLPGYVKQIVSLYNKNAEEGESLHEMMDRVGASDFVRALAPYSQDAADSNDPFGSAGIEAEDLNLNENHAAEDDQLDMDLSGSDDAGDLSMLEDATAAEDLAGDADRESSELESMEDFGEQSMVAEDTLGESVETGGDFGSMDDVMLHDEQLGEGVDLDPKSFAADVDLEAHVPIRGEDLVNDEVILADEPQLDALNDEGFASDANMVENLDDLASDLAEDLVAEDVSAPQPVKTAPVAALAPTDELDLEAAPELSEEEQTSLEERLTHEIEDEAEFMATQDVDMNEDDRLLAIQALGDGELAAEASQSEALDELDDVSGSEMEEIEDLSMEELKDSGEAEEMADLDERMPPAVNIKRDPVPTNVREFARPRPSKQSTGDAAGFSGVQMAGPNRLQMQFENGAYLEFDCGSLEPGQTRNLKLAGQQFTVARDEAGFRLSADGVEIFYPLAMVAA